VQEVSWPHRQLYQRSAFRAGKDFPESLSLSRVKPWLTEVKAPKWLENTAVSRGRFHAAVWTYSVRREGGVPYIYGLPRPTSLSTRKRPSTARCLGNRREVPPSRSLLARVGAVHP
jgi:hypothetical protein